MRFVAQENISSNTILAVGAMAMFYYDSGELFLTCNMFIRLNRWKLNKDGLKSCSFWINHMAPISLPQYKLIKFKLAIDERNFALTRT